jgi:hypothetical protein
MSLISLQALAQSPIKISLQKGKKFTPTEEGYFINKLYSANIVANHKAAVQKLEARIVASKKKAENDVNAEKAKCAAKIATYESKLASCDAAKTSQKSVYDSAVQRLSKQQSTPWYKSPYLHFAFGLATCGGAIAVGKAVQ